MSTTANCAANSQPASEMYEPPIYAIQSSWQLGGKVEGGKVIIENSICTAVQEVKEALILSLILSVVFKQVSVLTPGTIILTLPAIFVSYIDTKNNKNVT